MRVHSPYNSNDLYRTNELSKKRSINIVAMTLLVTARITVLGGFAMQLSMNALSVKALESDFAALVVTRNKTIFWANEAAGRLFGYNSDELIGQPTDVLFPDTLSYEVFASNAQVAIASKG